MELEELSREELIAALRSAHERASDHAEGAKEARSEAKALRDELTKERIARERIQNTVAGFAADLELAEGLKNALNDLMVACAGAGFHNEGIIHRQFDHARGALSAFANRNKR